MYWYDDQSRILCRHQNPPAVAALSQTGLSSTRMAGGPLGKRNLFAEQRNQKQPITSPGQTEAKKSATAAAPSEQPRRAISDAAALEILDYILTRDSTPVATALIFTHANDLTRSNLGGETTFRELQNRMVQWAQKVTRRPNVCVFIFQDTSRDKLLETCQCQELTVLSNFLKRQEGRTTYVRDVNSPSDSEILRLIHRYRLSRNLIVDWTLLPHMAGLLARQNLTIKLLRAKLEHTANLNRETLLEWSGQKFIQAKEHIIQHLGARMLDVNTNELRQKLSPVIGQQDNIELVIGEASSWLGAPCQQKPLTLFMVGTSGVGKTYTVQLLAEALQPYGFDFCEFQMTEFSEAHRVSSLIGSPPGYTGSEDEPRIFQALRQSSRLVILFDEIEKAHRQVITALMQLIDEGKLSWNRGQGDFRDCILCFTSNAQRQEMVDLKQSTQKANLSLEGPDFQNLIRDILVRAQIAPEVCGRINRFLIFNPLTLDSTIRIASQQVHRLAAEYKVDVQSIHPEFLAKSAIASEGSIYGARPIRDHVREILSNSLTSLLREYPRTRRIRIEKNDTTGSYSVCAAVAEEPTCQTDESGTAIRLCQGLQRQERMLDQDAMKQVLSQVYCQQDEIALMIREVVTWFGQVEKQRPMSLFLAGTSGVGKTFTCKLLAKAMEPQKFAYVYFPMSEYSQESHVTNLIGSSSGYQGSQETPKIFAALERSKRLVIVFDEIEKAHPSILKTLMQLLEEGVLSWSKGEGDFRQCIICFTSNAQRKELVDLKSSYRCSGRDTGDIAFQNEIRDVLTRADIAPEICGRFNRFFVYNPLTPDAVFRIVIAEMQKIARSYELELVSGDPELLAEIALSTSGSPYGARPITRRIENILGHPLLQFKNRFPDVTHVSYQRGISGYDIVAINPQNGYPDLDALMHKAQST